MSVPACVSKGALPNQEVVTDVLCLASSFGLLSMVKTQQRTVKTLRPDLLFHAVLIKQ
jgi:hypothetical protein